MPSPRFRVCLSLLNHTPLMRFLDLILQGYFEGKKVKNELYLVQFFHSILLNLQGGLNAESSVSLRAELHSSFQELRAAQTSPGTAPSFPGICQSSHLWDSPSLLSSGSPSLPKFWQQPGFSLRTFGQGYAFGALPAFLAAAAGRGLYFSPFE